MMFKSQTKRVIYINDSERNNYCDNTITTAKYNLITFLPRFLFEQFRQYSYLFFLFSAVIQQIPNVSPTGEFTTAVPLIFILSVSAVREIYEDIKRHKADRKVNRTLVMVLQPKNAKWKIKFWYKVKVGDIVKVKNEQFFPSDLLLISSCEPNGMCYIETSNLDGETNLKIRQSLSETSTCITPHKLISDLSKASIDCDLPNRQLYEFHGNLKIAERVYPIGPENILLRGAKLRNTNWIYGCVLYTGHESKLMMNSTIKAPLKRSNVEKITNRQILFLFCILIVICLISATMSLMTARELNKNHFYLQNLEDKLSSNYFFVFLTFVILYNNFIPISLIVTLEMVRFIQAHFINSDLEMYCYETDTPASVRTSNLNEELGQVRFVLSDKTGTLTQNVMEFKKCSIAGNIYEDKDFDSMAEKLKSNDAQAMLIKEFFILLSVCQTVVPEDSEDKNGKKTIVYHSASPDEGAIVEAAKRFGYEFIARTPTDVYFNVFGVKQKYEILNVLDFTSSRKRMSVIVRLPDRKIKLYMKGADSVIYERLSSKQFAKLTETHLTDFATEGLRTLCCASTEIEETFYQKWNKSYNEALTATKYPDGLSREEYLNKKMSEIERNLILVGATAIEDKLQDDVPLTIDILLKAGIHVWMLTGDKHETAINIGYSCKLLTKNMQLIILTEESEEATYETIQTELSKVSDDCALVIEGKTLYFAMSNKSRKDFMTLALKCRSVICCRVSPAQKAEIVEAVKETTKQITLAIGDGANDIAMIRAANVGVGISGREGLQAVHSADYAIAQFKFLSRLLLVHGSWCYSRLCKLILYSFYKNIALYVTELWYATQSAWSGQAIFDRWIIALYNVIFTAAPPLAIGLLDRQCTADIMIKYPVLYQSLAKDFNVRIFWIWIASGLWHSLILFWLTYWIIFHDTLWSSGLSGSYLVFGTFLFTYVVITVCMKAGIEITSWTWLTHAAIWGSICSWFLFLLIYSRFWPRLPMASGMSSMDIYLFSSPVFWCGLFFIPLAALLSDIIYKIVSRTFYKTLSEQIIEAEKANSFTKTSILNETPKLIKSALITKKLNLLKDESKKRRQLLEHDVQHGYAFSQEENSFLPQSQLIRAYDTTKAKPKG